MKATSIEKASALRKGLTALSSLPLAGIVLFIFSVAFPPFDDASTLDLSTHMLQHILIVLSGVMISYPLYLRGAFARVDGKKSGAVGFVALCVILAYWHFPGPWDSAVLNPFVHALEHLSFLFAGIVIGSLVMMLSDVSKVEILMLGFLVHLGYGWLLISDIQVYPLYALPDQALLGLITFSFGPIYWALMLYLIFRNKAWFQEVSSTSPPEVRVQEHKPSSRVWLQRLRRATAVMTISLLVVLVGFYGTAVFAINFFPMATQPHETQPAVVVYIAETPISWQYSPTSVRVVLGVNSTVTWVSHSISFDTVTGVNYTALSSGPIAPGSTFSFTFTQPGSYEYRCIYHPWMIGHVDVVAGNR